jgi:hypothetical protein
LKSQPALLGIHDFSGVTIDGRRESRQNARSSQGCTSMGHIIAFPRVPGPPDHRRGPDRRRTSRGGRRETDRPGYAPLVLLVDSDGDSNARCEAILARLRFAVAPTRNLDEALRVMDALRPNVIVARPADAAALRRTTAGDLPIVLLADDLLDPEQLVDEIRRELRLRRPRSTR